MKRILGPAVAVVLVVVASAGAAVGPLEFRLSITSGFPAVQPSGIQCGEADASGVRACSARAASRENGQTLTASATQPATGRSGVLDATCDWDVDARATANVAPPLSVTVTGLEGTAAESCAWSVRLATGSLAGTMRGSGPVSLVDAATGAYDGTISVDVAGGSGEFAGVVGSGTFAHRQTFPLTFSPRALAAARAEESQLTLALRTGRPRVLVAAPQGRVTAARDSGIRVVTAPRSRCSAIATAGRRRVSFARVADRDGDGEIVLAPRVVRRLARGTWKLAVSCAYSGGTASTRVAFAVA